MNNIIAEKDAQIVALREALESSMRAWRSLVNSGDAGNWNPEEDAHIILGVKALSDPVPAVVPVEDVRPLVMALSHYNCSDVLTTEQQEIAYKALAAFTAKHPLRKP